MVQLRNRVREFRELHRLTQEELARLIGVTKQTISNLESNGSYYPSGETMVRLTNHFNCELGVLFYVEREVPATQQAAV